MSERLGTHVQCGGEIIEQRGCGDPACDCSESLCRQCGALGLTADEIDFDEDRDGYSFPPYSPL